VTKILYRQLIEMFSGAVYRVLCWKCVIWPTTSGLLRQC